MAKPDVPRPSRSGRQGRRVLNPPPPSSSSSSPTRPSRSGRRPLRPSSSATAAAATNSAADKKKGLLIDKGKEWAGDPSPEPEKPSRRRRKVKEGAAKADVRRAPSARCQNRKALSDPSSEPKKPRVSAMAAASEKEGPLVPPPWSWERPGRYERGLRILEEEAEDGFKETDVMYFDYEKFEREEMEKGVAKELQFVKDGIQRWVDRFVYGIGVRPRKPKEIASDDPYLSKPPGGSYSDETLKSFLDLEIQDQDHHPWHPNFKKSYLFKLKKEQGYLEDRSKDSDRGETTLSQIEPGPFPLIGETSKKTRGSDDPLEENS